MACFCVLTVLPVPFGEPCGVLGDRVEFIAFDRWSVLSPGVGSLLAFRRERIPSLLIRVARNVRHLKVEFIDVVHSVVKAHSRGRVRVDRQLLNLQVRIVTSPTELRRPRFSTQLIEMNDIIVGVRLDFPSRDSILNYRLEKELRLP